MPSIANVIGAPSLNGTGALASTATPWSTMSIWRSVRASTVAEPVASSTFAVRSTSAASPRDDRRILVGDLDDELAACRDDARGPALLLEPRPRGALRDPTAAASTGGSIATIIRVPRAGPVDDSPRTTPNTAAPRPITATSSAISRRASVMPACIPYCTGPACTCAGGCSPARAAVSSSTACTARLISSTSPRFLP